MRQDLTEIVFILDRSGSMSGFEKDTIGGVNKFIEEQKKVAGSANVSIYLFDNEYTPLFEDRKLNEVTPLTSGDYFVRGSTALLDAMGKTINSIGSKLSRMKESYRPSKVIFVIMTDGQENASHEFTNEKIKDMIKHQEEKYSWQFVFLSADPTQFDTARNVWGLNNTFHYSTKDTGIAYASISSCVASYRNSGTCDTTALKDLSNKS